MKIRQWPRWKTGLTLSPPYAHVDGKRTVYIPVTKRADASTLEVIHAVKAVIPSFKKALPPDVAVSLEFDQSPYVTNSLRGLVTEGLLGAALTGLMVLIFLRAWSRGVVRRAAGAGGDRDDAEHSVV